MLGQIQTNPLKQSLHSETNELTQPEEPANLSVLWG